MSYDIRNFEKEALQESFNKPVVVDFWAPWCGPCRILGPLLEKLNKKSQEKWVLKKLNVDENQEIAAKYNIRGIPAVKLFRNGVPVSEFTGALPEIQVEKWLKDNIPSENDEKVEHAIRLIADGKRDKAKSVLEKSINAQPDHSAAAFHLAKLILFDDPARAGELFQVSEKDPKFLDHVSFIKKIASLLEIRNNLDRLSENHVKPLFLEGIEALARQDFETAIDRFIQVVIRNKSYENEIAREAAIAVFSYLGPEHEITRKFRRRFDMALY